MERQAPLPSLPYPIADLRDLVRHDGAGISDKRGNRDAGVRAAPLRDGEAAVLPSRVGEAEAEAPADEAGGDAVSVAEGAPDPERV